MSFMVEVGLLALALMLVLEGLFPFISPEGWRTTFRTLAELPARHIRMGGLASMLIGVVLLLLVRHAHN
jgi:uncharacterized protein YjeT (DUF2065 family)